MGLCSGAAVRAKCTNIKFIKLKPQHSRVHLLRLMNDEFNGYSFGPESFPRCYTGLLLFPQLDRNAPLITYIMEQVVRFMGCVLLQSYTAGVVSDDLRPKKLVPNSYLEQGPYPYHITLKNAARIRVSFELCSRRYQAARPGSTVSGT
ncbi:hypothetical protein J6590_061662 [Homalodisca vitripennis]|nr:hypothetical protein J6590_061662 [Homalodisca vitripennis]